MSGSTSSPSWQILQARTLVNDASGGIGTGRSFFPSVSARPITLAKCARRCVACVTDVSSALTAAGAADAAPSGPASSSRSSRRTTGSPAPEELLRPTVVPVAAANQASVTPFPSPSHLRHLLPEPRRCKAAPKFPKRRTVSLRG